MALYTCIALGCCTATYMMNVLNRMENTIHWAALFDLKYIHLFRMNLLHENTDNVFCLVYLNMFPSSSVIVPSYDTEHSKLK